MTLAGSIISDYLLSELRALGVIDDDNIFEGFANDYVVTVNCIRIPKEDG